MQKKSKIQIKTVSPLVQAVIVFISLILIIATYVMFSTLQVVFPHGYVRITLRPSTLVAAIILTYASILMYHLIKRVNSKENKNPQ
jgi:uncharacterized BrkB/YihY/UPF0761 family membrane protein